MVRWVLPNYNLKLFFLIFVPDAIPSSDQIRIAPSLKSQRGSVWTKTKAAFENWEVEVTFRVTGRGRIGADGLVRSFLYLCISAYIYRCICVSVHMCISAYTTSLWKSLVIYLQAIWYTENQGLEGPVFGSADMWNGVGIFFDSFDNDGKVYLLSELLPTWIHLLTKLGCEKYSLFNTFVWLVVWEISKLYFKYDD